MMQILRPIGSAKAALGQALEALSPLEINAATGVSPQALWEASNPGRKKLPALEHAAGLAAALRAKGLDDPVSRFFEQHRAATLARLGGSAPHQPQQPQARLLDVTKEVGDIAGELRECLADGALCNIDKDQLRRQVAEAREALDQLERDIAAAPTAPALPIALRGAGR